MTEFLAQHTNIILIIIGIIVSIMVILQQKRIKELEQKMNFTFNKIDLIDSSLMSMDVEKGLMPKSMYIKNVLMRINPINARLAYHLFYRSNISIDELSSALDNTIDNRLSIIHDYNYFVKNVDQYYSEVKNEIRKEVN